MIILSLKIYWKGKGLNEKAYNYENNKLLIECDKKYFRPLDVNTLLGNASKAKSLLKWKPKFDINSLVKDMVSSELLKINDKK